jgi:hypothetical protein
LVKLCSRAVMVGEEEADAVKSGGGEEGVKE